MVTVLEFLVLAILLFIAAELYVISRELFRLSRSLPERVEPKEGQTINVNLGQLPVASPQPEPALAEKAEPKPIEEPVIIAEPEPEPEPPPPPPPPPRPSPGMRATASGLTALKCPKCQSENSSYRTDCFNCGEKLK